MGNDVTARCRHPFAGQSCDLEESAASRREPQKNMTAIDTPDALPAPGRPRDYSLTGEEAQKAIDAGLAAAEWYHTDIPRKEMKALMQRSDGSFRHLFNVREKKPNHRFPEN